MSPWWPKMELKNHSTTVDNIITSGQIFLFEVSKQLYNLADMIISFASGTNASMVVKIGTKYLSTYCLSLESNIMDRFKCLRCVYDHINLPTMIGSFASGATASQGCCYLRPTITSPRLQLTHIPV